MPENSVIISIFDLDGTLSKKDTYLPYLAGYLARNPTRWLKAVFLPFAALMFFVKMRDNHWLKEIFLKTILSGETKENVAKWNEYYLDDLFNRGLREDIVEILRRRQIAGDEIILSTASLDIYVPEIANRLLISRVTCTKTEWKDDRITGKLVGNNCYGVEKLRRLKEYLQKNDLNGEIHVYSDHTSDWPIMEFSHKAFAVYPTRKMKRLAIENKIQIIEN